MAHSITCFDDIEYAFINIYAQPMEYHALLTQFTQIHLEKNEKIRDFNILFFNTIQQILEDQCPNSLIIFGC
jgi:hypothetical protein